MDIETFSREARKVAKSSFHLSRSPSYGQLAAIWGGSGLKPELTSAEYKCWITVDCRFLPLEGKGGCLSVYTDIGSEGENPEGAVVYDSGATLEQVIVESSLKLFAKRHISLPPASAVFRIDSPIIQEWIKEIGWRPSKYDPSIPYHNPIVKAYDDLYDPTSPFHREDIYAVLGGWNFPFPDTEWDLLIKDNLLLSTLAESEPWVEVWDVGNNEFKVCERVT